MAGGAVRGAAAPQAWACLALTLHGIASWLQLKQAEKLINGESGGADESPENSRAKLGVLGDREVGADARLGKHHVAAHLAANLPSGFLKGFCRVFA